MVESIDKLVRKAQRGDVEAFAKLVEAFQDAVFGAAYASVENADDAQDIAQETFILAYQELPRLREPVKFPGWLRRLTITARNRFVRARRTAHDLSALVDVSKAATELLAVEAKVEANELQDRILQEISALSEKNRLVTVLYLIDGYSYQEIGDFLEVPVSTVKSRLHESRKRLRGRLEEMAQDMLQQEKPGAEFIRQLREKLNGRIVELSDSRTQVFYDFVNEKQSQDWVCTAHKGVPQVRQGGLAFGRIEPDDTESQWDRDIRLKLVLDPDPAVALEIDFDVTMGTNEPWSCAAWILTQRDGPGPGIRFLEGVITDWSQEWRAEREGDHVFKEGHLRADFLRRFVGDMGSPGEMSWVAPTLDVPLAEPYHMRVVRQGRALRWEVNGQEIGKAALADDELCLTARLMLANYGKGTGAVFRNVVIRARLLDVDASWPARARDEI